MKKEKKYIIKSPKRRISSLMKIKKEKMNITKINIKKEKEINSKNDEIIKKIISSPINSSIYNLIFSILITFFFSIFFTIFFVIYSYNFNKKIFLLINALNCLKDLNENIGETFYYSVKLTIVQNPKYINIQPSSEEIKLFSRNTLISMYNEMISLLNSLYFNSISFSQNNYLKIQNYKVNLSTLSQSGIENITQVPVLNLLQEYTSLIYIFANIDDSKINFLNSYFNELLKNSQTFLYGFFSNYTSIYEDEYLLKINYTKIFTYCLCFSLIPFEIFGLYLILISSFKVSNEKEKYINFFFQIDKKTILQSMNNCKKFIKATSNTNISSKHLIATPKINLQVLNKNNLSEFEDDNLLNNNYIKKKENENENEEEELSEFSDEENLEIKKKENKLTSTSKLFRYEKKAFKYLSLYIIFLTLNTLMIILLKLLIDNKYHIINKYQEIYSNSKLLKNFITRNVIFFRVFIVYKSSYVDYLFVNEISNDIKERLNTIFDDHALIINEIYNNIDKNFLSKRTKDFYEKIQKKSLCHYLENFTNNYGGNCDSFGFGIAKYGLNSITTYIIHSIMSLYYEVLYLTENAWKKGFLYSELFYGSFLYTNFSQEINPNDINEYYKFDPFSIFNRDAMRHLIVLNDHIFKVCIDDASNLVKEDIQNVGNNIINLLIYLFIIYCCFLFCFILFYVIPDVIKKNKNINKRRKLLMIIPKKVLLDIISKNI